MRNLLEGKNIRLTALKDEDNETLEQWFNNMNFMRNYDILPAFPQSRRGIEELINYYANNNERILLGIRLKDNNTLIGVAGFDDILWNNDTAFLFIGVGDMEYRGKGYGKEAINLLVDYGFNELNFYKLQLNVIQYNRAAINLYEGIGFIKEGTYRQYVLRDGQRFDLYLYGLLKDEWKL